LLVSEPSLGDVRSKECKVNFLIIVGVEDESIGRARNIRDLGYCADRSIEDVVVICCELSGRDGT
jgi:hypothetical protein